MEVLKIRKLADRSQHDEMPAGGYPLAGIAFEGGAPDETAMPVDYALSAQAEGWLTLENLRPVVKPAGPADDPLRDKHVFMHADAVVFHTVDGDVRYEVTRQPDKYDGGPEHGTGEPTDAAGDPETSVEWIYVLKQA